MSGLVVLALAGPAAAATSCGKKVLQDWFDNGRVDKLYDLHCYEDAIDLIPADIRDYADAEDVINRALQGALNGKLVPGGPDPTPDSDRPEDGSGGGPGDSGSGDAEATPEIDGSGASSVPIPLLVLGGMSLALLAAGALGYVSRRRHAAEGGDVDDDTPG